MIDNHEGELVVVVSFPKLGGDAEIVKTVVRHELITTDFVPLFSRFDARGSECVDTQADRGAPRHGILNEFHLLAIPRKQKWTRAFETLLDRDLLVGFEFKVGADRAVGPDDANDVCARLFAESEVQQWSSDRLLLDH